MEDKKAIITTVFFFLNCHLVESYLYAFAIKNYKVYIYMIQMIFSLPTAGTRRV